MQRSLPRLIITGIALAIGWVTYQLADVTDCSGPRSDEWAEATLARIETASDDYDAWGEDTTLAEFAAYAERAEARYQAQLAQDAISCIEDLQEHTVDFFHLEWKMYEAASEGQFDLAYEYDLDSAVAYEAMLSEIDKIAERYDWEME